MIKINNEMNDIKQNSFFSNNLNLFFYSDAPFNLSGFTFLYYLFDSIKNAPSQKSQQYLCLYGIDFVNC